MRSSNTMSRFVFATALAAVVTLVGCGPSLDTATVLELSEIPSTVAAGQPLEITVTVKNDKGETVTAFNSKIDASVSGPSGNEAIEGEKSVTAKDGVAVFNLTLTRAGAEQQLLFRPTQQGESRLALKKSKAITVTAGGADHLELQASPKKGAPGGVLYPFALVRVVDKYGNLVTSAVQVTAALGANQAGGALSGTTTLSTVDGAIEFGNLVVDKAGAGYTLVFSAPGVTAATSTPFEVGAPKLVYTDPTSGTIQLVRNATLSGDTGTLLVLDVKVGPNPISKAYAVGLNLPVDLRTVKAPSTGSVMTFVGGLNPGTAPAAVVGALHTQGAGAGILTAGVSQKAAGVGADTSEKTLAPGTVLFQVRLEVEPKALFKTVFDGAALDGRFAAAVRDREGNDQVRGFTWGVGKLEVQ